MEIENKQWVYAYDDREKYHYKHELTQTANKYELTQVRYLLGEFFNNEKEKALVCIGVNPSTALPEALDPTLARVRKYAKENGYGGWYMLNIYPHRATNPNDMHTEIAMDIHDENLKTIKKLFGDLQEADIWCAWGGIITKRKYLKNCLTDIVQTISDIEKVNPKKSFRFMHKEAVGKELKHPLHPIASVKTKERLQNFDIENYLKTSI